MNPNTSRALASLIIPCWNQIDFTRQCIAALVRHTRAPWELIVVDNGSTDGTRDYLAGVQDAAAVPFTVIANATNRGFPAAINQGLQVARGEYLVLLNNDVVVTDGWLDQLIALTNAGTQSRADGLSPSCCPLPPANPPSQGGEITCSSATDDSPVIAIGAMPSDVALGPATTIGLVGPMSNYAAPPQLVADVSYRDLDEMHAFARQWRDDHRGQWFTTAKLSGFCLLMKRAVYDAVGGLDERFGLGFFDDDDLAERARRAGFGIAVAHDLFVHHFGSRTFVGNGIDTETLLDQNAGRFADKWGVPRAPGRRVALQPFANQRRSDPDDHRLEKQGFLPRSNAEGSGSEGQERLSREQLRGTGDRLAPDSSVSTFRADPRSSALIHGEKPYSSSVRSVAASAIKVSLTMIVRDEEANLPHCLESARGLFDEIVVVDTGSTDRTKEIALEFGARVFDFVWIDDFAAACNAALEHATGDYAFWLDADDVIDPGEREKLRRLLDSLGATDADCLAHLVDSNGVGAVTPPGPPSERGGKLNIVSGNLGDMSGDSDGAGAVTPPGPPSERGGKLDRSSRGQDRRVRDPVGSMTGNKVPSVQTSPPGGVVAYVVRCACDPSPDGTGGETVVDHVRLFPLRPDVRWSYRVHEQIMPALRRADVPVRWSDCTVRHTGYTDLALRARKLERDSRILREELKDRPDDPFVLLNLGAIAIEQRDWRASLEYLKRSLAGSAPTDSITCKLFALIARAHQMLGDSLSALRTCEEGLKSEPADAELWFRKAVVHRHRGESTHAEACWRRILTLHRPEQFRSVDLGIYGHLTRRNLAALAAERGDHGEVERLWRAVLAECPGDREALGKLQSPKPVSSAT